MDLTLTPGAAFHLTETGQWETRIIPNHILRRAIPSGTLMIHGYKCTVFDDPVEMGQWAQRSNDYPGLVDSDEAETSIASRIASVYEESVAPVWTKPKWEDEAAEFARVARDEDIPIEKFRSAFKAGRLQEMSDDDWRRLENTDSYDVTSRHDAVSIAGAYGRDAMSVFDAIDSGDPIPAAIVLERPDRTLTLVGGNTRLMAARGTGAETVTVFWVRI